MRKVLAVRDFRLLWCSQVGSSIADSLVLVALALYVNRIGSPTDVGVVIGTGTATFIVFLLLGGVWADRLPRNRVMIATDLWRGGLHALLAVLILTGHPAVWVIALIEGLFGVGRAFFRPAYSGLIPQTVPEDLLNEAQAMSGIAATLSTIVGPSLGAVLFVTVGAGTAFAIDAATFGVSAAVLTLVRARDRGGPTAERAPVLQEMAAGLDEIRRRPWAAVIIASAAFNLLVAVGPAQALGPEVAHQVFGHAALYGGVSTAFGVGLFGGSLLALRWQPEHPVLMGIYACLPWTFEGLIFALGPPYVVLLGAAAIGGFGIALFEVWWVTSLTRSVPPAAMSRVSSVDWMGSLGLLPVGLFLAGPIAATFGARETLAGGAVLSALMTLAISRVPSVRAFRSPEVLA